MSVSVHRANGKAASARDRSRGYLARVDSSLESLRPLERRAFLVALLNGWEYRYRQFVSSEGSSERAGGDPATAADFLITIAGIAARLQAEA